MGRENTVMLITTNVTTAFNSASHSGIFGEFNEMKITPHLYNMIATYL